MQLAELVRAYIAAKNLERPLGRELSFKTREHLTDAVAVFSRYLNRPAIADDLTAVCVNEFLRTLIELGKSPYTVRNRRTGLRVLWRFAHDCGLVQQWCGVRTVHCPPLAINGYDVAKMQLLLAHVATLRGVVRSTKIPRPTYWDAFLKTDWEVGLRIGDMLMVTIEHFDATGWLWTSESKTGKAGWRRLRLATVESIAACIGANPSRERIWPGYTRKNICRAFTELAKAAGVGGTSKYIRSGGSSEYDRLFPGNGWRFLRHSSPEVWEKHYRVDRICDQDAPSPPPL